MNIEPWQEWVAKAEEDWEAAQRLSKGKIADVADVLLFLCQQTIEKYLKALLVQDAIEPPYTHNLAVLLDMLEDQHPELKSLRDDVESLTPLAVVFRYPGMWATVDEAKEAIERAERIRSATRDALGLHT